MIHNLYHYRATVDRVIDGDTVDLTLDLGCGVYVKKRVRLWRINAPERGTPKWSAARDYLADRLGGTDRLIVRTVKDKTGKYGRLLGQLYVDGVDINTELVTVGLAEFRMYEGGPDADAGRY